MQLKILDVSKYQPNINYGECAKAIDGVILRCGITYWGAQNMGADPCFEKHYNGFKAQSVPVGAYYYSAADSVAVAEREADFCISLLKDKQFEMPVYYDIENNERQANLSCEKLTEIANTFCERLEKAGYFVGVYASTSWFNTRLDFKELSAKYTVWLADYRVNYEKGYVRDMHQYTSTGTVQGISGSVDLSRCYRDFTAVITAQGLNGFKKTLNAPLSSEPVRLICIATGADKAAICAELDRLEISYKTNGDEIITGEVSSGDQAGLVRFVDGFGINWRVYTDDSSAEISALKKSLSEANSRNAELLTLNVKLGEEISALKKERDTLLEELNRDTEIFEKIKELIGEMKYGKDI